MNDRFRTYISKFVTLTEEEAQAVGESITIKEFNKGSILLQEGQISREGYFILKGCIRKYSLIDGEEKTTDFYTEEEWVSSNISYTQKIPADHYISCVEDSTLIVGNTRTESDFYKLFKKFPRLEKLTRSIMESEIIKYQEMLKTFKMDSPEQRYLNLMKYRPELIQRVPLHQLANYIGVKPESLSRIRKRILGKA